MSDHPGDRTEQSTPSNVSPPDAAFGGYPPLNQQPVHPPATSRKRSVWVWLGPAIGTGVVIVVASVFAAVTFVTAATTPRNESLASKTCVAAAVDQPGSPAHSRVSNVLAGRAVDVRQQDRVTAQFTRHTTVADALPISDVGLDFVDTASGDYEKHVFLVSGVIDGEDADGVWGTGLLRVLGRSRRRPCDPQGSGGLRHRPLMSADSHKSASSSTPGPVMIRAESAVQRCADRTFGTNPSS
jgi:hypothetical protein